MNTSSPRILVVGGGLGGLALAQGLRRAHFDAVVLERDLDPTSRLQGRRISLNAVGIAALEALLPRDRYEAVSGIEVANVGREFHYASSQMTPWLRFAVKRDDVGAVTVRRGSLRTLLAEGLHIEWGRRVVELVEGAGGVQARFADGSSMAADLVVGADGVGSHVREVLRARNAGVPTVITTDIVSIGATVTRTATLDDALPLCRDGAVQFLGPAGVSLFVSHMELDDGSPRTLWAVMRRDAARQADAQGFARQARTEEGRTALLHEAVAQLDGPAWHPSLRALVQQAAVADVVDPIVVRSTRVPSRLDAPLCASGRLTLLGDAAHAMPPHRGLGGNRALDDARLLVDRLRAARDHGRLDWPAVMLDYERTMLERGRLAVEESEEAAQLCHVRNPVSRVARAAVLRTVGFAMSLR